MFDITPARKLEARISGLYRTMGEGFETSPAETLDLTYEGIPGDRHAGITRPSGSREPWYPRGTEMRNERQITILSPQDLAETAAGMEIDRIDPEWIGGNILLDGVDRLSFLPAGTLLFFENGVTLAVQAMNGPCRFSGAAIAKRYPGRDGLDLLFPKVAKRTRGLLAWVEKPGTLTLGEVVRVAIPEQWIYA
ncbi:MAG: molybdenum cofactor sulfurase [Rhodobiaceae bacterium]|nr:molybdenum cofactor sulfurase [Rhodobiaceae bacterium]